MASDIKLLEKQLEKTEADIDGMIYLLNAKRKKKRFLQEEIMKIEGCGNGQETREKI